jgi:hypothetical protein
MWSMMIKQNEWSSFKTSSTLYGVAATKGEGATGQAPSGPVKRHSVVTHQARNGRLFPRILRTVSRHKTSSQLAAKQ